MQSRRLRSTRLCVSRRLCNLSNAVFVSSGFLFRILTPARSNDFVLLKDSDEILPSNRKVFGVAVLLAFEGPAASEDSFFSCCAFVVLVVFGRAFGFVVVFAAAPFVDFEAEEMAGADKVSDEEGLPGEELLDLR